MKVCFTSDLHGDLSLLKNLKSDTDLLVICGDLFGDEPNTEREILEELNNIGIKVLITPGNHDNYFMYKGVKEFNNLKFVADKIINLKDYNSNAKFDLLVFSYVPISIPKTYNKMHWAFKLNDKSYRNILNQYIRKLKRPTYFVGHYGPVSETNYRKWNGYNYGLEYLNDTFENEYLVGYIHGHLHENGEDDERNGKKIYNVAKILKYFDM